MSQSLKVVAKYLATIGGYVAQAAGDIAEARRLAEVNAQKVASIETKVDQILQALGPHLDEHRSFRSHVEDAIDRHGKRLRALENGKRIDQAR